MIKMDLTVAIISYNTKDLLRECLRSISDSRPSVIYEIVVVDNSSTDGSGEMVKTDFPDAQIIENQENAGFARACNQALTRAVSEYVLILNSDTVITEGCLDTLFAFMKSHKDTGAVGPLILNFDNSVQYSSRNFPSFLDATVHAFLGTILPSNPFSKRYKRIECSHQSEQEVDWISGAAMCVRKEAASSIGRFDEAYHMYVEDMDFCYRLWRENWKVYFLPDAKVYHYIGQSSKQMSQKMIIEHQKSIYRFYSKLYQDKPWRYLKLLIGLGLFLRGSLLIFLNWVKKERKDDKRNSTSD